MGFSGSYNSSYGVLRRAISVNAGEIAKEIASILGGSRGDAKFAQGGGKDTSKKDEAIAKAKSMILDKLKQ